MTQNIIVAVLVACAVLYAVYRLVYKRSCGCGSEGCGTGKSSGSSGGLKNASSCCGGNGAPGHTCCGGHSGGSCGCSK